MQKVIPIRSTEELERKLEKLIGIEKAKRSALMRRILDIGIAEEFKKKCTGVVPG